MPKCSMRELLVKEAHSEGLMGHFGVAKTLGGCLVDGIEWDRIGN